MVGPFGCSGGQVGREVRGLSLVSDQGVLRGGSGYGWSRWGSRGGRGYGNATKEWPIGGGCSVGEVGRGSGIAGLGLGGFRGR